MRELEEVCVRRLLLPSAAIAYAVSFCVVIGAWVGIIDLSTGYRAVLMLALEGHVAAAILLVSLILIGDAALAWLGWAARSSAGTCRSSTSGCR